MANPILSVKALSMNFGGVQAIDSLDMEIVEGEIVSLIGPNGAGKTTFFNCLTGVYSPTCGDITIWPRLHPGQKMRINGLKMNTITEMGLARTFQNIRLFPKMTCLENVMIGRHCRTHSFIFGALLRNKKTRHEERQIIDFSYDILRKVQIDKYMDEFAENLPYGVQRRLEIARALATEPFLLLLDEPAAGLNPKETDQLNKLISELSSDGLGILMIEHDMRIVMSLSDRVYVMDHGKKIAQGTPAAIRSNSDVINAYLGEQ